MNQGQVFQGLNPIYPSSSTEKNQCEVSQLYEQINSIEEQRLLAHDGWKYKIHEYIEEINGLSKTLVDDLGEILKWKQTGAEEIENEARIELGRLEEATRKLSHIDCVLKAFSTNADNILCTKSGNNNRLYAPQQNNYTVVFDLLNSPEERENMSTSENVLSAGNNNKTIDGSGETGNSNKDQSFFFQTNDSSKSHSFINTIENM
jgi:hypothetical protein